MHFECECEKEINKAQIIGSGHHCVDGSGLPVGSAGQDNHVMGTTR